MLIIDILSRSSHFNNTNQYSAKLVTTITTTTTTQKKEQQQVTDLDTWTQNNAHVCVCFFFPSSLTKGTRIFSAEFVKKKWQKRETVVCLLRSLLSLLDSSIMWLMRMRSRKNSSNDCSRSAHATKQTPPQTDTHTQRERGVGGGKRERESGR